LGGVSLSSKTKNNYIKRLIEPFDEFVKAEIFTYNFFSSARGYKVTEQDEFEARDPFTEEQLKTIFESEKAIKLLSSKKSKPSRPWILLISLFTGARPGEILSLPIDGIIYYNNIPCFNITVRSGHNRLKRPASKRVIPIHPSLIALGFMDYFEKSKKAQSHVELPMLFPDVTFSSKHGWGRNTGRWINDVLLEEIGVKSEKHVLYSFRHNVSDIFRRADSVNSLKVSAYIGHKEKTNLPEWKKGYGSPYSPSELLSIAELIQYDLNFSKLKAICLDNLIPRVPRKMKTLDVSS
jgi:integrase